MTIYQFISHIKDSCAQIYCEKESQSIAYILAKSLFGEDKIDIILNPNREIDPTIDIDSITMRLKSGEPIQYILGKAEFYDLEFEIGKGALIPRPETEELIDWILKSYHKESSLRILDIGTGSGCIAITLAHNLPHSTVYAIDVELNAIYWAEQNAKKHKLNNITTLHQDVLCPIDSWDKTLTQTPIDIIVSNPPYIPIKDIDSIDINVKGYEPHSALFVPNNDSLLFYRSIAISALNLLNIGGELYFEIYELFSSEIIAMLSDLGYKDIEIRDDINSKPRMCRCVKR